MSTAERNPAERFVASAEDGLIIDVSRARGPLLFGDEGAEEAVAAPDKGTPGLGRHSRRASLLARYAPMSIIKIMKALHSGSGADTGVGIKSGHGYSASRAQLRRLADSKFRAFRAKGRRNKKSVNR